MRVPAAMDTWAKLRGPHIEDGEAHDGTIKAVRGDNGDFALKSFALPPPTVALNVIPIPIPSRFPCCVHSYFYYHWYLSWKTNDKSISKRQLRRAIN